MPAIDLAFYETILDSLNDGLYVCDRERRIMYWSKSAERITGWTAAEVVGKRCMDNVLSHVDQDGRKLCSEEFCPLFRSMVTDSASSYPLIVFSLTKTGHRLPVIVSVAPMHDKDGNVIGGVETFHDFSDTYANLERARRVQTLSLEHELPKDPRVGFASHYLPRDMIGGDYFSIRQLDDDRYVFMLADMMGHGVAAALYTMYLSFLWSHHWRTLAKPAAFADLLNQELCQAVKDESFATAILGVLDASNRSVCIVSAGGPPILVVDGSGKARQVESTGYPLGSYSTFQYEEISFSCQPGESLLVFTDGAVEICDSSGNILGPMGFVEMLKGLGYPASPIDIESLHRSLLRFSNGIRLADDLTLLELKFTE